MFSCMIISFTCDLHLGSQIQNMVNINNQPNNKKKSFFLQPFRNELCNFQICCTMYDLIKCI